jgi:hypothetical protein
MKNISVILIFCLFFVPNLIGQQAVKKSSPNNLLTQKFLEGRVQKDLTKKVAIPAWKTSGPTQKMDSAISERYETLTGKWEAMYSDTYIYNANQQVSEIHSSYGSGIESSEVKVQFHYDAGGNDTLIVVLLLNAETSEWMTMFKSSMTYDSGNHLLTAIDYEPDEVTGVWMPVGKTGFTYDSEGRIQSEGWYNWWLSTNDWLQVQRWDYTYNTEGNLISCVEVSWSIRSQTWGRENSDDYVYDSKGNRIEYLQSLWNDSANIFVVYNKEVYSYDVSDRLILTSSKELNSSNVWEEFYRSEQSYDEHGDLFQGFRYSAKDTAGNWSVIYKSDYTFNTQFSYSDLFIPSNFFGEDGYIHMPMAIVASNWDDSLKLWNPKYRDRYSYSGWSGNSVQDAQLSGMRIYPNPVVGVLFVETDNASDPSIFELLDMQGRKVISESLTGLQNQISVNGLPGGIYIYRVTQQGEIKNGRLVIR